MRFRTLILTALLSLAGLASHTFSRPIDNYNGVFFFNNTNGWIVGESGRILRTVDAANNFTAHNVPSVNRLNAIHFPTASVGYAVGFNTSTAVGVIFKTIDAGNTWAAVGAPAGSPGEFFAVFGRGSSKVWIGGAAGVLFRSDNGGSTWVTLTSGITEHIRSIYFTSDTNGVFVADTGTATIRYTTNQGGLWTTATGAPAQNLESVKFLDSNTGVAVGNLGTIVRTVNGGANWSASTSGTSSNLRDVTWESSTVVWAVGESGAIVRSSDGGLNFTSQTTPTALRLNGIASIDTNLTLAVGDDLSVFKSTGGGDWTNLLAPVPRFNLKSISMTSGSAGLISGNRGFFANVLDNDGRRFLPVSTNSTVDMNACVYLDATNAYISGNSGAVFHYNPTTRAFTSQSSGVTVNLRGVGGNASTPANAVAAGDSGNVIFTTTSGSSWGASTIAGGPISENLYGVSFTDASGMVVGNNNTILFSGDSGANFSIVSPAADVDYRSVHYIGSGFGLAVGIRRSNPNDTVISYTVNDGGAWSDNTIVGVNLKAVAFGPGWNGGAGSIAYAAGDNGVIYKSSDGTTWTVVTGSPTANNITSITSFQSGNNRVFFFAGDDHTILRTQVANGESDEQDWQVFMPSITPSGTDVTDLEFENATTGWLIGGGNLSTGGFIKRTTNSGAGWLDPTSGGSNVTDLSFASLTNGYALGTNGFVQSSGDGGDNWSDTTRTVSRFDWRKLHAVTSTNVVIVGASNTALNTTNSGTNWAFRHTRNDIRGLFFVSATAGLAVGANGMGMFTNDSGGLWEPFNTPGTFNFNGVLIGSSASEYIVIRDDGRIYKSTNAGTDWSQVKGPEVTGQYLVKKPGTTTLLAAGALNNPGQKGAI